LRRSLKVIALALAGALAGCTMSTGGDSGGSAELLTWPQFLARPRPAPDHVIRYGEDAAQVVDLYVPQGRGPFPTLIMIHGGCWSQPWDRTLMNWAADDLRRRGYAVWNIDYRTIGETRPTAYPALFEDVAAAADALREHGPRHGLDLSRVVTIGHSAGGHLALWLAARRKLPSGHFANRDPLPIYGAISLGGLQDLELAARPPGSGCGTDVVAQLVGGQERSDPFADTSVPRLGALGIPQVLVNGNQDRIIPTGFAEDYAGKMRAAGDRDIRVRMVDRTGHVELIAPDSAAWAVTVREIERMFRGAGQ
jgi:acetyl esterase/lipase